MKQLRGELKCAASPPHGRQAHACLSYPLSRPYIRGTTERKRRMLRVVAIVLLLLFAVEAKATEAGWALLRDGEHVVLMRHAMAPGAADPANFDIEKCSTQRNLSDRGKQQARKIGALFAARAAPTERVLTSRYCRTTGDRTPRLRQRRRVRAARPSDGRRSRPQGAARRDPEGSPRLFRFRQSRPRHPSGDDPGTNRPTGARGRGRDRQPGRRTACMC